MTASAAPDISVVVTSYNQWPRLRLVLHGLTRQTTSARWDLLLIDDGSDVPIRDQLEQEPDLQGLPLRLITLPRNVGRNAARNLGAGEADGDYILFLDGDALPYPGWIEGHFKRLAATGDRFTVGHIRCIDDTEFLSDPESGELQPDLPVPDDYRSRLRRDPAALRVTRTDVLADPAVLYARSHWGSLPMSDDVQNWWLAFMFFADATGRRPFLWQRLVPHNCGLSRQRFLQSGGFDTGFPFYEGMDLGLRLIRSGCSAQLADDAVTYHLYHHRPLRLESGGVQQQRIRLQGLLMLLAKHADNDAALAALLYAAPPICPDEFSISGPGDLQRLADAWTEQHARAVEAVLGFHATLLTAASRGPVPPAPSTAVGGERRSPHHLLPLSAYIDDRQRELEMDREQARALVHAADYQVEEIDGQPFVNYRAANTWHLRNTPRAFARWMQLDAARLDFVAGHATGAAPRTRQVTLAYQTRIDTDAIPSETTLWLWLPFPLHDRHQRVIEVTHMTPSCLALHVDQHLGVIVGAELQRVDQPTEISYSVTLAIDEIVHDLGDIDRHPSATIDKMYFQHYLQLPSAHYQRLRSHATDIVGAGDVVGALGEIYQWVLANKTFTLDDSRSTFDEYAATISERRPTSCIGIAVCFVLIARAADIPARLVQGYLQGFPTDRPGKFESLHLNPGFSHQWAEVYVSGSGWIPVEFHSCVLRPPILNRSNVPDAVERSRWAQKARKYERYFLGSLDNMRVRACRGPYGVFSPQCRQQPATDRADVHAVDLPIETRIRLDLNVGRI